MGWRRAAELGAHRLFAMQAECLLSPTRIALSNANNRPDEGGAMRMDTLRMSKKSSDAVCQMPTNTPPSGEDVMISLFIISFIFNIRTPNCVLLEKASANNG
jgi:hypothetical protein